MNTNNLIKFKEELNYCYEWTISKNECNQSLIRSIIKSPVFITENNTKWYLKANLRNINVNEIDITLNLINSNETEVFIKFNLFNKSQEKLLSLYSSEQKINGNQLIVETINFDPQTWFCSDRYGLMTDNFTIYWQIIHSKSQPSISQKVGNHLINDLKSMINNKDSTDLTICVNGHEFMAHKSVLTARSEVFAAMFASDMKENLENKVEVNDIEVDVFQEFLNFVYTGNSDKIELIPEELLTCAEKYGLIDLKNICEEILCQNFTHESAISLLLFAVKYNANYLKERLISYIALNYSEIKSKSYNSLNELFRKETKLLELIVDEMADIIDKN